MTKSLYEKTVSSTTKMLFSSVFMFLIQFFSTVILARVYNPSEFGILSKILIITSFADVFCQLGLGQAIVQKVRCSKNDYDTVSITSLILGILTTIAVYSFAIPISNIVNLDNELFLKLISPAFLIISLSVLPIARAQREMRFNVIIAKDIASYLGYVLTCVILGSLGLGIYGLIAGLLVKYFIATIVSLILAKYPITFKFSIDSFMSMFNFGFGFSLCKICSVATDQSDYYAIARMLNNTSLGLYNRAFQLVSTPISLIGQSVDQVFFSTFSKMQGDEKRISESFICISSIISILSMFATISLFYFSGFITIFLFGEKWIKAATPIALLSLAIFFRSTIKITDPIMRAKGFVYHRALFHCINTIITLFAAMYGSRYDLIGVSLGVVFAQFLNYVINVLFVATKLHVNFYRYFVSTIPCNLITIFACVCGYSFSVLPFLWNGIYNLKIFLFIICILVIVSISTYVIVKYFYDEQITKEINRVIYTFKTIFFKKIV